jgi:hypothetical protein
LVDAVTLRQTFREHFVQGLRRLFSASTLTLEGEFAGLQQVDQQEQLLSELASLEWVSYIEPPPHADCRPEHVLRYLARYLTGGPISDQRIISADERQVTFWAREGQVTGGERQQVPVTLSAVEFTRRWTLHILPKGYTKARRFGGWSNRRTAEYLEQSARLLDASDARLSDQSLEFDPSLLEADSALGEEAHPESCPDCGTPLQTVEARPKPSWYEIMHSPHRPSWYARGRLKL